MEAIFQRAQIRDDGTITVPVNRVPGGTIVDVIVLLPGTDSSDLDLTGAAGTSTDFWENVVDDETWNNA